MDNMDNDQFLNQRGISLPRSQFLKEQYENSNKNSYDPQDIHGRRLSSIWKQNDTFWSVFFRKAKGNFLLLIDPDTFSKENMRNIRSYLLKEKVRIVITLAVTIIPITFIAPILRPKLQRIHREFIFQYYMQSKMISKQLQTGTRKVSKQEMQQILKQVKTKIGF